MYECEGFYDGISACLVWQGFIREKTWYFKKIELAESIFDKWIKTGKIPDDIHLLTTRHKRIGKPILW
jgi:hypothetical protein